MTARQDNGYEDLDIEDPSSEENNLSFLEEYRVSLVLGLMAAISIGLGIFSYKDGFFNSSDQIEILNASESAEQLQYLIVEITGAVNKPGVYELENGSRIDDLIKSSGGLQDNADKVFLDKIINRAAKLTDGQKIYIPYENEQSGVSSDNNLPGGMGSNTGQRGSTLGVVDTQTKRVNINTASQSELESMWGIGPATAKNIIEQRPYSSVEELLSKKILKKNVYERNVDMLSVY